jgi:nicotinate-nucleotide pyrophosphorylase
MVLSVSCENDKASILNKTIVVSSSDPGHMAAARDYASSNGSDYVEYYSSSDAVVAVLNGKADYVVLDEVMPEECRGCVMRNICPTCYGENFSATGNIHSRDMNLCPLFKIQFRALAFFAAEKFRLGMYGDTDKAEIALILKSALRINDKL